MGIYQLNPLADPRWPDFLDRHPMSSVFHTAGWLRALQRTYGYEPVAYTTTPPGRQLSDGVVFCHVRSWLSGRRLVSLPFSDHCQPLIDDPEILVEVLTWLKQSQTREPWKYVELRPVVAGHSSLSGNWSPSETFSWQVLDLRPDAHTLFHQFHKSCVQRKIHRAEREKLTYEQGRSEAILRKFYFLLILTRRRHGLPPQPLTWFRNLFACLGNRITIRVASQGNVPVAGILTIFHKQTLLYKYGCSDARFNNLGGTHLVFWRAIQEAKDLGLESYDLGRSESDNSGLVTFKENWGAVSRPLHYYRLPAEPVPLKNWQWHTRLAKSVFSKMPETLLTATGKLLYRHIG